MKPLSNYILIEPEAAESRTASGLHLPETAKEKPVKGTVKAIGPGRTEAGQFIPVQVALGDTVLYARYAGTDVSVDGKPMLLVRETDVMAVL